MFRPLIGSLCILSLGASAALSAAVPQDDPVYVDNQYTAIYEQHAQRWRLTPFAGAAFEVTSAAGECPASAALPRGVWLVSRGADGALELLAPSAVTLAPGQAERVPLRACEDTGADPAAVRAPRALIDWLESSASAVYVDG